MLDPHRPKPPEVAATDLVARLGVPAVATSVTASHCRHRCQAQGLVRPVRSRRTAHVRWLLGLVDGGSRAHRVELAAALA